MKNGAMEVFKSEPSIKVVSSQPTSWDANKAREITATVLQQHPNLCAVLSVWGRQSAAGDGVMAARQVGSRVLAASNGSNCLVELPLMRGAPEG